MTVTTNPTRNEYTSTASQSVFTYDFKIFEATDLSVYHTPAGQVCSDSDLTTAYSVTDVGEAAGGTIVLTSPASSGDLITIVSDIPESRTTDYQFNGDFIPSTVNDDFDRVVSLSKQTAETVSRSLKFDECLQNASELSLPRPVALRHLRWKGDLSGLENVPATGTDLTYFPNVYDFGAVGDGVADDTIPVSDFLAAGGGLIPPGMYSINDISISGVVHVDCQGTLQKRSGVTSDSILIDFLAGSEGSTWKGGVLDGDRAALSAAYATVNPTYPGFFAGWFGMKTSAANITVQDVRFVNWVTKPFWFAGDYNIIENITAEDHGDAGMFGWEWFGANRYTSRPTGDGAYRQAVRNIKSLRPDNNGVASIQHAIDLEHCEEGDYTNISVEDMGGDLSGLSTFCSGITAENCIDCKLDKFSAVDFLSDTLTHLGISMLGCINSPLTNPIVTSIAGLAIEQNACDKCVVTNPTLDGKFKATTAVPAGASTSLGVTIYSGAWNVYRTSKSSAQTTGLQFIGGVITRFTDGVNVRNADHVFIGINISGNINDGAIVQEQDFIDHFAGANVTYTRLSRFIGCIIRANGNRGIVVFSARSCQVEGGDISNNGQNTGGSSRMGIVGIASDYFSVTAATVGDDQSWTDTDICTFEPQSSVNNFVTVYISVLGRIEVGQYINLVNGSGAGDIIGKVWDIDTQTDAVIIQTSGSVTLSSTGNTSALTGTWTGSGTTITGTGTSATTEIRGTSYVTDGSEWRRVLAAAVATEIIIDEAFTTPLSGSTLTILTIDLTGIPSQQVGVRSFGAVSSIMLDSNTYEGNVISKTNLSVPSTAIYGCEYFRNSSTLANAPTINLQTAIASGHSLIGVASNNDVAISGGGATSYELKLTDSGGTTLESVQAGVALAQNTKVSGSLGGVKMLAGGNLLRVTFAGGTPTAGNILCEALYRVDGVPELADA